MHHYKCCQFDVRNGHSQACPEFQPRPAPQEASDDLKQFTHGEEGTHYVCPEVPTSFRCCACAGHDCKPSPQEAEGWEGSLDAVIRDNLIWYKEHGQDHGDLVIAEEAIKTKVRSELTAQEQRLKGEMVEDLKELVGGTTEDSKEYYDKYHRLIQKYSSKD